MTGPPPPGSPQQLLDMVAETLDPGYTAAAKRCGPQPSRRRFDHAAVVAGCLLIGFVLVVAYIHTNRGAPEAKKLHDRLVSRVRNAESAAERLAHRTNDLQGRLTDLRAQSLPEDVSSRLAALQLLAGSIAVHGPGVVVTLGEPPAPQASAPPPGRGGSTPIEATHILTDRDVRSVVNELWADGAEAISVNDVRLTAASAVRFAGEAVLIDFKPIRPPYVIRAIGDPDTLITSFADSAVASRYQTRKGVEHIGFDFREDSALRLPAAPPATPKYARRGGR